MLERKGWKPRKNSLPTGSFWNCLQQKCPQGALFSTVQTSKWPWDINMLIPPPFPPQPGKPRVRMAVLHGETEEGKMSHWKNWECTPNTLPLKPIANISHQRYFPLASASRPAKPLCLRQTVSSLGIRGTGSPRWIIKSTVSRSLQFKTSSLGWPLLNSQGLAASACPPCSALNICIHSMFGFSLCLLWRKDCWKPRHPVEGTGAKSSGAPSPGKQEA